MRADQYDSIIECLIELIRLQDEKIHNLELLQTYSQQKRIEKAEQSKLLPFMELFGLLSKENNDVEEKNFVYELVKTGKFTEDDAYNYIKKAMQNGQIYERKTGVYAKA